MQLKLGSSSCRYYFKPIVFGRSLLTLNTQCIDGLSVENSEQCLPYQLDGSLLDYHGDNG